LHQMANVTKLISGQNEKVLEMVYEIYKKIFPENIFKCSSIKVAESSKILENTQRDVNIALINEFSHLTEKLGISIHDVLDAANTKWNFIDVKPGFPGGECIPVDPYYYIELAERNGVTAELAKAARNINDNLFYLINKIHMGMMKVNSNKIALLGLSYKSNVPDMKNSMGIKLFSLLKRDTVHPYDIIAHDPLVDKDILKNDSGIEILELDKINNLGSIILMESDSAYVEYGIDNLINKIEKNGYFYDIPGLFYKQREQIIVAGINYWSF